MKKQKRWINLNRAFYSSVLTVVLIEFSQVGDSLIDGIITSRMLGTNAIAAVGLGHPVFSIAGIVSGVLAVGMEDEKDPFANIGVRMVQKIAKDIKYYNTLKLNYTIITV